MNNNDEISKLKEEIKQLEKRIRNMEDTNINGMFKRLKTAEQTVARVHRKIRKSEMNKKRKK